MRRLRRRSGFRHAGSLEPSHVVPRDARSVRQQLGTERVEVGDVRAAREEPKDDAQQRPSAPIQQVGVVEVHVDDGRQLTASQGAGEVSQRVRRGNRPERASRRELDVGRLSRASPSALRPRGTEGGGLGACSRRSRARRRPPPPRRRCTSRPRRRVSASSRVRAWLAPPPARELPSQRLWGGRGRGPSSACGARAGHVTPHPWPAGPTRARPLLPRHPQAERAPLWRSHPVVPPAARRSAPTPRRREVAQRGRTRPRTVPATWRPSSEKYRRPPR